MLRRPLGLLEQNLSRRTIPTVPSINYARTYNLGASGDRAVVRQQPSASV